MNILPLDDIANRNLGRILSLQAQQIPQAPCYLVDDRIYTFGDVNRTVNRYAAGLSSLGVKRGDRVVIFMRSCVEFIMMAFAANKIGAIWVPINGDYKGTWLADAISESKGVVLVTDTDKFTRVEESLPKAGYGKLIVKSINGAAVPAGAKTLADFDKLSDHEPPEIAIYYGDTCAILWTSGTTGKSKGVLQPHNVWINTAESPKDYFTVHEGDVVYNCLPLYNTGAWITNARSTSIFRRRISGTASGITKPLKPRRSARCTCFCGICRKRRTMRRRHCARRA